MKSLRYSLTILRGSEVVANVMGLTDIDMTIFTVAEAMKVVETEQFLERLTGYRFHLQQELPSILGLVPEAPDPGRLHPGIVSESLRLMDDAPSTPPDVQTVRDPAVKTMDCWRVTYNGRFCSPTWYSKGPADAYADALRKGTRKPEYPMEERRTIDINDGHQ